MINIKEINWNDRKAVIKLIQEDGRLIMYASDSLKRDSSLCITAVRQNGLALRFTYLRNDKNVVLEAFKNNPDSIQYASKRIINLIDGLNNAQIIDFLQKEVIYNEKEKITNVVDKFKKDFSIDETELLTNSRKKIKLKV